MEKKDIPKEIAAIIKGSSGMMNNNWQTRPENNLKHRFKINQNLWPVRSVAITPDNKFLIITHENTPVIKVLDLSKLEFTPHQYNAHHFTVRLVSPSPDSQSFYTASWDGNFNRFHIHDGSCELLFCGTRSPSVFVDPNMKYLFVGEYPDSFNDDFNRGRCWDLQNKKTIAEYQHISKRDFPESVDIAYDQHFVYTGSDGIVYKWQLFGKKPLHIYFKCNSGIRKIAVSETLIAAATNDGILRIHKKTGELFRYIKISDHEIKDVRIAKDESFIVCSSDSGKVSCWSLESEEKMYSKKMHRDVIWSICLAQNDTVLISGGTDGFIHMMDAKTGEVILQIINLEHENDLLVAVPPDKNFRQGFFYTTNTDWIEVIEEKKDIPPKILEKHDKNRMAYIDKLNMKNLIISRIKNKNQFDTLMKEVQHHHAIRPFTFQKKLSGSTEQDKI